MTGVIGVCKLVYICHWVVGVCTLEYISDPVIDMYKFVLGCVGFDDAAPLSGNPGSIGIFFLLYLK